MAQITQKNRDKQGCYKLKQVVFFVVLFWAFFFLTGCQSNPNSPDPAVLTSIPTASPSPSNTPTVLPTAVSTPEPTPKPPTATPEPTLWQMGFDASYVSRVEERGGVYRNAAGKEADIFQTLASYNVEMIRLRVWVDPEEGYNNKEDVLALSARAHEAGLGLVIDFHYSDTWADPENQTKPVAWANLDFDELKTAVFNHSAEVVGALIEQGTPPEIVQIGNEIIHGMLFPDGQVGASSPLPSHQQWTQLTALISAGIEGVQSIGSTAQILIHIDHGGEENGRARWFFDNLKEQNVSFDMIGISYYPRWHGELNLLEENIRDTIERYQKPVIVMETSAMWTLGWNDHTHNAMGLEEQQHPGFAISPEGQMAFFEAVSKTAMTAGASGVFYWGGEWIAVSSEDDNGSAWENQALFDFDGYPLPAFEVFQLFAEEEG